MRGNAPRDNNAMRGNAPRDNNAMRGNAGPRSNSNRPNFNAPNNAMRGNAGPRHDFSGFRNFHQNFNAARRFRAPAYRRPPGYYSHRWSWGEIPASRFLGARLLADRLSASMTCRRRLSARSGYGSVTTRC